MPMTQDEVFAKVKEVLTGALAVDDEEVTPTASLKDDLGAESIDFLDIQFQLEKTFGIKVPKDELNPQNIFSNPELVTNGKVTEKGLAELKARMPYLDLSTFEKDPDVGKFLSTFTVDTLVKYVMSKVN